MNHRQQISSGKRRSHRLRRIPVAEGLESRALLDAGGHFDLGFGIGTGSVREGYVTYSPSAVTYGGGIGTQAIAVQSNGDIVEAGVMNVPNPSGTGTLAEFALIRLLPAGNVDTTFGTQTETTVGVPGQTPTLVKGVVIQSDGKILVLGSSVTTANSNLSQLDIIRLNSDGSLDTTFGTNGAGFVTVVLGAAPYSSAGGIAVQANGQIVVDGSAGNLNNPVSAFGVARLNLDGSVDATFGTNGQVLSSYGQPADLPTRLVSTATSLAIQPDGKIVVAGNGYSSATGGFAAARLNADGSFDTTFATAGKLVINTGNDGVASLALAPDGGIVLAGGAPTTSGTVVNAQILDVIKLTPSGAVDPSFQLTGMFGFQGATNPALGTATAVAVQPDGKVVVVSYQTQTGGQFVVVRLDANGLADNTFGNGGGTILASINDLPVTPSSLAIQPNGKILIGAVNLGFSIYRLLGDPHTGDYTGDGKADVAVYIPSVGAFAIRPSEGGPDEIVPFGFAGPGGSIPTPGDYDGVGRSEIAAYLPAIDSFAIRPSNGGPDRIIPFGISGAGNSIPAQGDYNQSGVTDLAVYLPSLGAFAIRPSGGGPDQIIPFGIPGAGNSIPVPGDYDNSGRTELAVYLPTLGVFAYRPANGGADVITQFGIAGKGNSIPVPGDYDGSGQTELAVYLPTLAVLAFRPALGGSDVSIAFGAAGIGQTIPAPADYTGDGKTDIAAYLPGYGTYAYRSSSGGADFYQPFGIAGAGNSIPVDALPGFFEGSTTVAALSLDVIPLTLENLAPGTHARKAGSTH